MKKHITAACLIVCLCILGTIAATVWTPSTGDQSIQNNVTNLVSQTVGSTTTNAIALPACVAIGPENVRKRFIQNTGTVPLLYSLGSTASSTNYAGVLAAGTVARDGLGSVVNLEWWRGSVSVAVESGTGAWCAVEEIK